MAKITILDRDKVPQGPFSRDEVTQKIAAGAFTLDSLAHVEGLAQWTPLREVLAKIDAEIQPQFTPPLAIPPPPASAPAYSYAVTMEPPPGLIYAGFWLRFAAYFVDLVIVLAVALLVGLLLALVCGVLATLTRGTSFGYDGNLAWGGHTKGDFSFSALDVFLALLLEIAYGIGMLAFIWLYFALPESGPQQATIGKRFMGIYVADMTGQRIHFWRASARFACKIVGKTTFGLGFIMAGFTEHKQALHDMIAGTLVVRR